MLTKYRPSNLLFITKAHLLNILKVPRSITNIGIWPRALLSHFKPIISHENFKNTITNATLRRTVLPYFALSICFWAYIGLIDPVFGVPVCSWGTPCSWGNLGGTCRKRPVFKNRVSTHLGKPSFWRGRPYISTETESIRGKYGKRNRRFVYCLAF